jgi:hypothetical protein
MGADSDQGFKKVASGRNAVYFLAVRVNWAGNRVIRNQPDDAGFDAR